METGSVAAVRPVPLATTCARATGAADPATPEGVVEDGVAALLATAYAGCIGAAALVYCVLGGVVPGDGGTEACSWTATGPCKGTVPCTACVDVGTGAAGVTPAGKARAPGSGAVRSFSSTKKSRANGAMGPMGEVDMSEKGKKDSIKNDMSGDDNAI